MLKGSLLAFLVILSGCKKGNLELEVKIETLSAGEVGTTYCIVQGKVIDLGNGIFTQHGFCYSDSENPTIQSEATQLGERTSIGTFSDTLDNLDSNTKYYFRAYAQTKDDVYYDDQKSFTTSAPSVPELSTTAISLITRDAAHSGGEIISDGGASVTARGVCWSTHQNPTLSDSSTNDGIGTGAYTSAISGLSCGTTYYLRAYATNEAGTNYGDELSLTTNDCPDEPPVVTTTSVTSITETTAQSGGNVISDGGATVTAKGVCWSPIQNPTLSDSYTTDGIGTGGFTSVISGLSCGTSYYVRAYATNSVGTTYGDQVIFKTRDEPVELPVVTTTSVSSVTETSAQSGGNVISDGGATVTAKGVCWSSNQSPTLADSYTTDGIGTGGFTSVISGLSCSTSYYVRAYATNSAGTEYGEQVVFVTNGCIVPPTVSTNSISSVTETTAQSGGNVTSDGGAPVTAKGVCWSTSSSPTLADSYTNDGTGTGAYLSSISGLSCGTSYYIRAYATNSAGTEYGEQVVFVTNACFVPPTVTTNLISNIAETTAQSGGNVTSDGGAPVIAKGVCWSTSSSPTLSDDYTTDGTGTGSYSSSITGLSSGTTYYVRAYATNSAGTNYGEQVGFITENYTSVTDIDGNIYQIVTIGDQVWMAENLKTFRYSNGIEIPLVEGVSAWNDLTENDKAYCFYDNNSSNKDTYGVIYSWAAVMNGVASSDSNPSGVQGVCPSGWHVPSNAEWNSMINYLGGSGTAGAKLKETGFSHWKSPNTGANNDSGFTALPGGIRYRTGGFDYITNSANFWTTSTDDALHAWVHYLGYASEESFIFNSYKDDGFYVRCILDE